MTPEEQELEDQKKADAEAEAATAAEVEAKRQQVLSDAEQKARTAEDARIRAEAQLEGFKQAQSAAAGQSSGGGWSDEQWAAYTERTGVTKEQAMASAEIAQHESARVTKQFQGELDKANKKAEAAEQRLAKLESERATKDVKSEFYQTKPALARHKQVVDEFLAKFPEADQRDPAKLKELLGMAETYVKGKVGATMRPQGDQGGGPRLRTTPEEEAELETEVDTSGLKRYQADFIRDRARGISKEDSKRLEESAAATRDGVAASGRKQWEEEQKEFKKLGR